jgi:hypothetical protein
MSTKNTRSGGKYGGTHTTVSDCAALVCDIADSCPDVTRISPGFIKAGLPSAGGQRRVKISVLSGKILLSVRGNINHQEVHVYATDIQKATVAIARGCRDAGLHIAFRHNGISP